MTLIIENNTIHLTHRNLMPYNMLSVLVHGASARIVISRKSARSIAMLAWHEALHPSPVEARGKNGGSAAAAVRGIYVWREHAPVC